jgi:aryl-alcohol dehydrogenase-like predicted oxidoreductase
VRALESGCTLIDTSASYMDGRSEELIGKVLADHPEFHAFVVTKAGMIEGSALTELSELQARGRAREGVVTLSADRALSIHPDWLRHQIARSSQRLNRRPIDGVLLHNPEQYFDQDPSRTSAEEYYERFRIAFECLEEAVAKGDIRYYGVSSNQFPLSTTLASTPDLEKLHAIATAVSASHHFKLIEFPLNLLERSALEPNQRGRSLIALAKSLGIVTLSNRPLNASTSAGVMRLATYDGVVGPLDDDADQSVFDDCLRLIARQLEARGATDAPTDFPVVRFLRDSWTQIVSPDLVVQIFNAHVYPFLEALYGGPLPSEDAAAFANLQRAAMLYSRREATRQSVPLRAQLVDGGLIAKNDTRPLAVAACDYCVGAGVSHVLVGMRRVEYVDMLKPLFH